MVQLNRLIERLCDGEVVRDLQPRHRFSSPKLSFLDNPEPGVALNNLYLETGKCGETLRDPILGYYGFD